MTANVRIAPRNFWDLMTLSGSVAPDTGFEYTNTQSDERSLVWRSPDATGQSLKGALASGSVTINWAILYWHHCHGGSARFRAFSNNDWTGTTLVDTTVSTIYTPISTGYDFGYAAVAGSDTHDPLGTDSPYSVFFAGASGVKSVQWDFSSKSTTYGFDYWEVGRVFVGNYWEPGCNPVYGMPVGFVDQTENERTRGGSLIAGPGAFARNLQMDFDAISDAEQPTYLDIMAQAQRYRTVAVSVFPGEGGRLERDHTIVGKFSNLNAIGRQVSRLTGRIQIEEI